MGPSWDGEGRGPGGAARARGPGACPPCSCSLQTPGFQKQQIPPSERKRQGRTSGFSEGVLGSRWLRGALRIPGSRHPPSTRGLARSAQGPPVHLRPRRRSCQTPCISPSSHQGWPEGSLPCMAFLCTGACGYCPSWFSEMARDLGPPGPLPPPALPWDTWPGLGRGAGEGPS